MSFLKSGTQITFIVLIAAIVLMYAIYWAGKKKPFQIRRLPPLDAVEEIVGRCTEMGKPLMSVGLASFAAHDISGLSITAYAAELCAKNKIKIYNIAWIPQFIPLTQELFRNAYVSAGVGDMYDPMDQVRYYGHTPDSKYPAGVARAVGEIKPGGMIGVGWGSAAPMANLICMSAAMREGAMIIGGSPSTTSGMALAVTCDWLLIGEEVYAAGAYLSKSPSLVGSIVSQDIFRMVFAALLVIGLILSALGSTVLSDFMKL